jgi:hypothetical protein
MTDMYDTSNAGAVMLKIAVAVSVDPIAMRFKATLKNATNQTAFTGVCVRSLTFARSLERISKLQKTWK